jgi:hypothetical protein
MEKVQGSDNRILVVIPHFFNKDNHTSSYFGSHQTENFHFRKNIVKRSHASLLKEIESCGLIHEIIYLGISGSSLINTQVKVSPNDPRYLPWIAFDYAYAHAHRFDFVMVLEDDLEIDQGTLEPLLRINSKVGCNRTLIPNRIEIYKGVSYCTDLVAMPGWKGPRFSYHGMQIREPVNIHSGFLLLGAKRFVEAYDERPFKVPTQIIGDFMASAFANMHANQEIVRFVPTTAGITIKHNDNWAMRMIELGILDEKEVLDRIKLSVNE